MNCFERKPKKGYGFIYKYTSPSGKSYIGQTSRSLKERSGKEGTNYVNCPIFFQAIQKYGFEKFQAEILEEVSLEEIDSREQWHISYYDTLQPNGYNIQSGGKGQYDKRKKRRTPVAKYTLEGEFVKTFESVKDAAIEAECTYQAIEQVLSKKRRHHKGYIYRYLGEPAPCPIKRALTHGRPVGQFTLDNKFVNKFPSANAAARALGKGTNAGRNIRAVCSGDRKSAFGFLWKFLE